MVLEILTSLLKFGFVQSKSDYSLFTKGSGASFLALLVYVDDIVITGPSSETIAALKLFLSNQFKLKDLDTLRCFLALEMARSSHGVVLSQRHYALQLLEDTCFLASKPALVPMDPKLQLNSTDGDPLSDPSQYWRLIGKLLYLTLSKPDVMFVVHRLGQFLSQPQTPHLQAAHHLLRYIKYALGQGLFFVASSTMQLQAFLNADWASCFDSRKSTTGFCAFLGDSLVSWKSKK